MDDCTRTFVLEILKPSSLCNSSFTLDSQPVGQRELRFPSTTPRAEGLSIDKALITQACCMQFQFLRSSFLGFRFHWPPLSETSHMLPSS